MDRIKKIQSDLNSNKEKVWVPKAIAVASMYAYYDFFHEILADLHKRISEDTESLLEQHLFNIVFKIPAPIRNKQTIFYPLCNNRPPLEISLPSIEDLPFANQSHFELMLQFLSIEDIVNIFTHMLFE